MWIFITIVESKSKPDTVGYKVGFFGSYSNFVEVYSLRTLEEAEAKVHYLNGGSK